MSHNQAKVHTKAEEPNTQTQTQNHAIAAAPPTFKPHQMQLQHGESHGDSVYHRNRANPFHPMGGSDLWNRSELILKDQKLREKSGVSQIDQSLTRSYMANPDKMKY